jgi:hypothetical protein
MQDSKGYIWISTDEGLCRYNGSGLQLFNKKNGLPELSCYVVQEDKNGNIWIVTSTNRILIYRNDCLYESNIGKEYIEKFHIKLEQIYFIQFADKELYFHTQYTTYKAGLTSGKIEQIHPFDTNSFCCFVNEGNLLVPYKVTNKGKHKPASLDLQVRKNEQTKEITIPYSKNHFPDWRVITTVNHKGTSFICVDDFMVSIAQDLTHRIYTFPNRILNVYCDKDDGLWIGTYKNGVYYYPNISSGDFHMVSFPELSVTGICEDHEGGIWCATLEKGVFYCRNKSIITYANVRGLDRRVEMLESFGQGIFVSSIANEVIKLGKDSSINYRIGSKSTFPVSDLLPNNNGWLVSSKDYLVQTNHSFDSFSEISQGKIASYAAATQLIRGPHGRVFGIHNFSLFEIIGKQTRIVLPYTFGVLYAYYFNSNQLLVGTKDALFKVSLNDFSSQKVGNIEDKMIKIAGGYGREVYIITRHLGIYMLHGDQLIKPSVFGSLPTDRFYDLVQDPYHILWIGSNRGLIRIDQSKEFPEVSIFNASNGLPSDDIYKLAIDGEQLYLSTVEGICSFPLRSDLSNSISPLVYIRSVEVNGRVVEFFYHQPLSFSYRDNSLSIVVDALTFKAPKSSRLVYVLKGPRDEYHYQKINEIFLGNLHPGQYTLSIYAINNDGRMSKAPAVLKFEIRPPFWSTPGFIFLIAFISLLILLIVVNRIIYSVRKKERAKTRINKLVAEYQLTALQAQMNPHFIFNAINSIQTYILENQSQIAYDYLAKFSKLVRLVLYHAKDRMIPLEKELEILKNYILLEQMRFSNQFNFQLNIDPNVNTMAIEIPPMVIQPFVENAIWHGLVPLKGERKGMLKIHMANSNNNLHITIEDNGVGREFSKTKHRSPDYKSMGMDLIGERMTLLNNMSGYNKTSVKLTDLYDDANHPVGTRVEVFLSIHKEQVE